MKRLMIIADHSLVVHTIRLALRQTSGFQVVGFVDGRQPVIHHLLESPPDVVLVDDMQHPEDALARLRECSEEAPDAKLILLTVRPDVEWLDQVFDAGADAIVSKAVHPVSLGTLLREIAADNVIHRRRAVSRRVSEEACPLTNRELEILQLVAEGHTNSQIAKQLWVTEQTVKFHLSNTYRKLGVANRTEASRYAHIHSYIDQRERAAS